MEGLLTAGQRDGRPVSDGVTGSRRQIRRLRHVNRNSVVLRKGAGRQRQHDSVGRDHLVQHVRLQCLRFVVVVLHDVRRFGVVVDSHLDAVIDDGVVFVLRVQGDKLVIAIDQIRGVPGKASHACAVE